MQVHRLLLLAALASSVTVAPACKRDEPGAAAVVAKVVVAPVASDHPWVIAFLTELSITRPPGADGRLEGRTEADGYHPDPVFEAKTREALTEFLADYEKQHPRPSELVPVWEHEPAGPGRQPAWQLHFIDRNAGFELDGEASATLESGPAGPSVHLRLGTAQREQLAALTRAQLGDRVAIVIGDEVVMVPIIKTEVPGGELELRTSPGVDPEVAAPALLERLKTAG